MRRSSKTSMHIVNFTTPTSNRKPFRYTFTCSDSDRSRRNSPISKLVPLPVFEVQKNRLRCRPFSKLPSASVQAGQSPTTATATAASTRNARPCAPAAHRADLRQRKWGEQHIHLVTEGRSCSLLLPLLQYIALDWKNSFFLSVFLILALFLSPAAESHDWRQIVRGECGSVERGRRIPLAATCFTLHSVDSAIRDSNGSGGGRGNSELRLPVTAITARYLNTENVRHAGSGLSKRLCASCWLYCVTLAETWRKGSFGPLCTTATTASGDWR